MQTINNKGWFVYVLSAIQNDEDLQSNEYCKYSAQEISDILRHCQGTGFAQEIEPDDEIRMWRIYHPDLGKITFNGCGNFMEISIAEKRTITIEKDPNTDSIYVYNWIPGNNRLKNAAFIAKTHESVIEYRFRSWPEIKKE